MGQINLPLSTNLNQFVNVFTSAVNEGLERTSWQSLIPVQMAMLDQSTPILYMSEILELYKPSYQRNLMECRRGNVSGYIKFFLQCIIDQCNAYIYKLDRIKEIYKEDMKTIEAIKGNSVYKIMPVIMKQIVFTKKEIQELSGVSPKCCFKNY